MQLYCEYKECLDILPREQFLINPYTENDIYPPYNEKRLAVQHCLVFPAVLNKH